jgi:predicted regulator of Ras-like GTPase activity (Roadblock/LC7/MglB family)
MKQAGALGVIGPDDMTFFEASLREFLAGTSVRCALLCDRSGRLLTAVGDTSGIDRTTFASLAAAGFGASGQLAELVGEREFASLYHHGEGQSMYLADVGGWAVLAAVFDGRTLLGMVRLRLKTVVPAFVRQFEALGAGAPLRPPTHLGTAWSAEVETEIDRLFSEG